MRDVRRPETQATRATPAAEDPLVDPLQADTGLAPAPGLADAARLGTSGASAPLPDQDAIQRSFGRFDLTGIEAHTDAGAREANARLGARGFATGSHVALGSGADLHTQAHEAAHVMQQRRGVHLADGVGRSGDAWERHADAVADAVVGGESAEPLLESALGDPSRSAVQSGPIQLASAYNGRMAKHEAYGDSYQHEQQEKTDFTYHHIVPENLLVKFTKGLAVVQGWGADQAVDSAAAELVTKNTAHRVRVRAKDLTYEVNKALGGEVSVTESEVYEIVSKKVGIDEQWGAMIALIRGKVDKIVQERKTALKRKLQSKLTGKSELKKTESGHLAILQRMLPGLESTDRPFTRAAPMLTYSALADITQNHSNWAARAGSIVDGYATDTAMQGHFDWVLEDATTDGKLKRIVRDNGLEDDSMGLEDAIAWNPGNVHRGPSSSLRRSPGKLGFDALIDDGGNSFEIAAANLVSTGHFALLTRLNQEVTAFNAIDLKAQNLDRANARSKAAAAMGTMSAIYDQGTTAFNPAQWQESGESMELVRDDTKLRAAGLIQ